jgi:hypothetical protein
MTGGLALRGSPRKERREILFVIEFGDATTFGGNDVIEIRHILNPRELQVTTS